MQKIVQCIKIIRIIFNHEAKYMKKFKFRKNIFALLLGLVFALCAIPANIGSIFAKADDIKDAYKTPSTVDVSGSFESTTTSTPDKWTLSATYESGKDEDSSSFNGVISTEITGWDKQYEDWLDEWIETWDTNHKFDFGDSDRATIENELKTTHIVKNTTPLVPEYDPNKTKEYKVLAMMAGNVFTQYVNETTSNVEITKELRKGYVKYTSNSFSLDQYSFYKISVFVKTTDGANASISLEGDIEENPFTAISTSVTGAGTEYFVYTLSDGTNTTTFVNTTANTTASLTYDGHKYNYDSESKTYKPDTTDSAYTETIADYVISYNDKSTTANASDWTEYTIYVSTTTESSINLVLALGNETTKSSGNVYFDNVTVTKIQLLDFYKNATSSSTVAVYDNREILNQNDTNSRNFNVIQDFETANTWTVSNAPLDNTDLILVEEETATGYKQTFPQNNTSGINKILKVNNHDSSEVKIETDKFALERNTYYRISFWALSSQSTATLTVELFANKASGTSSSVKDTTKPYVSGRTDDTSHVDNFWVNYIFYVKAPAEKASEGYFNITMASGSTVYFDYLVMERVTKEEYTDSKNNKLDLSTTIKDSLVTNGNFFDYDSVDVDNYSNPLPPSNWSNTTTADIYEYYSTATDEKYSKAYLEKDLTFTEDKTKITLDGKEFVKAEDADIYNYKDDDTIVEKIILVKNQMFSYNVNKSAYINTSYDLSIDTNIIAGIITGSSTSNILSISTLVSESTAYKSAIIDMESTGSVYILTIDVKTDITANVNLKLVDSKENVYASLSNINTFNRTTLQEEWKTYKFYVYTGLETVELQLVLEFNKNVGTAQFKNINGLSTSTTSIVTDKSKLSHEELLDNGIAIVNLQQETFIEHSNKINSDTNLYDTNLYKKVEIDGKTNGKYGILDTNNPHSDYSSITAKDSEDSPYVLVIKNDAGESTKLEATRTFTLSSNKYMKITVVARVDGLADGKFATIDFTSLDKSFEISSSEFTEYILYVDNSDSDDSKTITYTLSLLDTAGLLIVDSISIESPQDLSDAKSSYPDGDTDTVKFVVVNEDITDDEEDDEKEPLEIEEEDNTLEIFFAVLSSLLLVVAIVFAIVYTRVKTLRKPRRRNEKNKVIESDDGQKGFV